MSIEHTWFYQNVTFDPTKDGHTKPIVDIPYKLTSTKDGTSVETNGRAYLDTSNISNFIELENVTVDNVRTWLDAEINMSSIEASHESQLNA
tara:strand:+ start:56 stop:331 length:276 start_codon:yes stop_codon:yes gene_type:complete